MITIYDIARTTGYSPATVSKALNNYSDVGQKTKKKILEIAQQMGYTPNYNAKALITKKSWMIGVLYCEDLGMGLEHPFFGAVIDGFKRRIEEDGYEIIFITKNLGGRPMSYLEHCKYRGVDAVFMPVVDHNDPEVLELINSEIHCVSSDFVHKDLNSVISDNIQGSTEVMKHLINLGHRRIAHIPGPMRYVSSCERFEVYKDYLAKENIPYDDKLVEIADKYDNEAGYVAMKHIFEKCNTIPTAVFAGCDTIAYGAIRATLEAGYKIPEDISFVGFDDSEVAEYFNPPLTTVKQNKRRLGSKAAEVLLSILNEETTQKENIRIPVELKIRASVKKI